jgi:hypothetical protein
MAERKQVFAVDPGQLESAYVELITDIDVHPFNDSPERELLRFGKIPNEDLLLVIDSLDGKCEAAIEIISGYGMTVGQEVFDTCIWTGRFIERLGGPDNVQLVKRPEIKLWHCDSRSAKDGMVSNAIKEKYGQPGTKLAPGFLYGMKADVWQAFALAAYIVEKAADQYLVANR